MWRSNYCRDGDEFRAFPHGLSVLTWVFSTAIPNHAFTYYGAPHAGSGETQAETTRSAHESARRLVPHVGSPVHKATSSLAGRAKNRGLGLVEK